MVASECEIAENSRLAVVAKNTYAQIPKELYIPPEALMVLLDEFSGPLDLLLYLIRKQNIDILNIPIVSITNQYMSYIRLMQQKNLDLTADYLLMAATLAEIKSRMLLPVQEALEEEEDDPRSNLVRRIQQYEQMKNAAMNLELQPRCERDFFIVRLPANINNDSLKLPDITLSELCHAMSNIMDSMGYTKHHQVARETFSVQERMQRLLEHLQQESCIAFKTVLNKSEGRAGIIVFFLAVLELGKMAMLRIEQQSAAEPIILYRI
jgi:segregation and condensation protein A